MNMMIGIDTGGTYTDGVLMACDSKKVLRSVKVFTTKNNLIEGIESCLDKLHIKENEHICKVCLSTTLATNAVVENRGASVGLIIVGSNTKREFPVKDTYFVKGKMNIMGNEIEPISITEVEKVLEKMKGRIDGLTISGYASVRNPAHELHIRALAEKILNVPIVCGHELTSSLGFYERTVTAVLNAKLIPIITELIDATKMALCKRDINAPLILVKGDGHLMIDTFAEQCPIETVMSGPAASMIGGNFLTKETDAVVVDIGGTTTDIVFMDDGEAILEEDGAYVDGWLTRVRAIKVNTFGLGGDSRMHLDVDGKIKYGPDRVVPLCVAVSEAPYLCDELKKYTARGEYVSTKWHEADCFKLFKTKQNKGRDLTDEEGKILNILAEGPHSLGYISEKLHKDMENLDMRRLVEFELVQNISMTPTDILHITGEYTKWDKAGSIAGANILAKKMNINLNTFLEFAEQEFVDSLCFAIIESAIRTDDIGSLDNMINCDVALSMITSMTNSSKQKHFSCNFKLNVPIIGVGASAGTWIRKVGSAMDTTVIVPEHADVANAVGTMTGNVQEKLEALIQYDPNIRKYIVHMPSKREFFQSLEEAVKCAKKTLRECSELLATKMMVKDYKVMIEEDDFYVDAVGYKEKLFIKAIITATIKSDYYIEE